MSTPLGMVVNVTGSVLVQSAAGQIQQPLSEQQAIYAGDVLLSAKGAQVVIDAGQQINIELPAEGRAELLAGEGEESLRVHVEEQVEALKQQLLAEDLDINELEASAAGTEVSIAAGADQAGFGKVMPLLDLEETSLIENSQNTGSFTLASAKQAGLEGVIAPQDSTAGQNFESGEAMASLHAVTEDFQMTASGQLAGNVAAQQIVTQFGVLDISAGGQWLYRLDNQAEAVQALGAGDTLSETISLGKHSLSITIHGSNDLPQVVGDSSAQLKDNGDELVQAWPAATGKLHIADADAGEARFAVEFGKSTRFGEVDIDGAGNWTYRLNPELDAVKGLAEGDVVYDFVSLNTLDGSRHTLKVEIEGTNHTAQIRLEQGEFSDANLANGVEIDLALGESASGKLSVLDPDFGQSSFQVVDNLEGKFGVARIDSEGNWSYQLNTAHEKIAALNDGEVVRDFVRLHSADNTPFDLIVTVYGSDQPAYASAALFETSDDALLLTQNEEPSAGGELYLWQPETTDGIAHIGGFHAASGGDTLVLSELLVAEGESLEETLHFSFDGDNTVIACETSSGTQQLVLDQTDLSQLGGNDGEIIQRLIDQGNLDIASVS